MKKLLLFALLAFTLFACEEDRDITGLDQAELELTSNPLESMVADDLAGNSPGTSAKSAGNDATNPIVVPPTQFVEHVLYTVDVCTFNFSNGKINGSVESVRTRFGGLFLGAPAPIARTRWVEDPNEGCLVNNNQAPFYRIFQLGTFYEIFGEVVRLSGTSFSDFWVRTDPTTGNFQRVNFTEDGGVEFGEFVSAPPSSDPNPDICAGVDPWSPDVRYQRGDEVTYAGYLFRRNQRGWRRIGRCG